MALSICNLMFIHVHRSRDIFWTSCRHHRYNSHQQPRDLDSSRRGMLISTKYEPLLGC